MIAQLYKSLLLMVYDLYAYTHTLEEDSDDLPVLCT